MDHRDGIVEQAVLAVKLIAPRDASEPGGMEEVGRNGSRAPGQSIAATRFGRS